MADTVITPAVRDYDSGASAAGWAIAVVLLLALILFGIFVWPGLTRTASTSTPTTQQPGANINVTLPQGTVPGTNSGSNSGTNGGTQQAPAGNTTQ